MGNFTGLTGGSLLVGTSSSDIITGLDGDDSIDGAASDDLISDGGGLHSSILGGAGNDTITYANEPLNSDQEFYLTTTAIDAGDGNDLVDFNSSRVGPVAISLGAGNDLLRFDRLLHGGIWGTHTFSITLGPGQDVIRPSFEFGDSLRSAAIVPLTVADFVPGDAGDVLDLGDALRGLFNHPSALTIKPSANPFASGHIVLLQDGADTIVRLDIAGSGAGQGEVYWRDLFRLVGVNAAQLTATNFAGWDPYGGDPVHIDHTGTSSADRLIAATVGGTLAGLGGDDWLLGNVGADTLLGGDDNDRLEGAAAGDRLDGGAGNDLLDGGIGNDTLLGGSGNDTIHDGAGSDSIDGGGGDDLIDLSRAQVSRIDTPVIDHITVNAGDGNDTVRLIQDWSTPPTSLPALDIATFDLGAGDDVLEIGFIENPLIAGFHPSFRATLGAGHDIVRLDSVLSPSLDEAVRGVITDFASGDGGDQLDLAALVAISDRWDRSSNPFASGLLRLVQEPDGTRVYFDYDGVDGSDSWNPVVLLQGVQAGSLTAWNFMGFAPGRGPVAATTLTGTAGADSLVGMNGPDRINGLGANDSLSGGFGNDTLAGGAGDDTLNGGNGDDSLSGGDGNDTLVDDVSGSDTLDGGTGDDAIVVTRNFTPRDETVVVSAGSGNDTLHVYPNAGSGHSTTLVADMGDGADRVSFDALPSGGTTLTLGAGQDVVVLDPNAASQSNGSLVITDFQTGDSGDVLDWAGFVKSRGQSTPFISAWNDDGKDAYNPFLVGNLYTFAPDFRLEQRGNDVLLIANGGTNALVEFRNVTLAGFTAHNLGFDPVLPTVPAFSQATNYLGTAGRDVITGSSADDQIVTGDGSDVVNSGGGNDSLVGGNGDDALIGGAGNDTIQGGDGADSLYGGDGRDQIDGGIGADMIQADRLDTVTSGGGDDRLFLYFNAWDDQRQEYADPTIGSIAAGDGNDLVVVRRFASNPPPHRFVVDLGAGDDTIQGDVRDLDVTLGTGRDRIVTNGPFDIVIEDFTTGDGGDIFDFSPSVTSGSAELVQDGTDTVLILHDFWTVTTARFRNTNASQFTAANFGGHDLLPHVAGSSGSGVTLTSSRTIAHGKTLAIVDPLPQQIGIDISNRIGISYAPGLTPVQFINHGTVSISSSTGASGFVVMAGAPEGGLFRNAADGVFTVTGIGAAGFYGQFLPFENDGLFQVIGSDDHTIAGDSIGMIANRGELMHVTNRGTFTVSSAASSTGILANQAPVDNSGTIDVTGWDYAVGVKLTALANESVVNSGTITVKLSNPDTQFASAGFVFESNFASPQSPARIVNSGTITADFALFSQDVSPFGNPESLNNSGTLNGATFMGPGNDTITNSGTMNGRTLLDEGDDLYDGHLGVNTGTIEGGLGRDTLLGGAQADILFGDDGVDQLSGGGGDDWLEGGMGNDTLDGGDGLDAASWFESGQAVLVDLARGVALSVRDVDSLTNIEDAVGSGRDDTLYGSEAGNVLLGVGGSDRLYGRAGDDTLIGGNGDDWLSGGAGNDLFFVQPGDGNDTIVDFAPGDRIGIAGYSAWSALVQEGADLRIVLSPTDSILLRRVSLAGFDQAAVEFNAADPGLDIPVLNSQTLFPKNDFTIASGEVLSFADTELVRHANATYLASTTQSTALALNPPAGKGGLGVYNHGVLRFETEQSEVPTYGIVTSIYNPYGGRDHWLVNYAGAEITIIAHHSDAVATYGVGGIWNAGSISVTSLSGDATAVSSLSKGVFAEVIRTFANTGTITVDAAKVGRGVAIGGSTDSVDVMINAGTILVHGGEASNGLENPMNAHPAAIQPRLVNAGTITVTDNTATLDSAGLYLGNSSHGEVWNWGTITADYSVRVVGLTTHSVVDIGYGLNLYNTGALNGRVRMSEYPDLVINGGTIVGDVRLGGGADVYDGRNGTLVGLLEGDDGNDTLLAGIGAQTIDGGFGDDTLSGGAGDDVLFGRAGADHFRMAAGFGNDTIADFSAADSDAIDVASYSQAQSVTQSGADVLVRLSAGDSLLVRNASVAAVTAALHFGASDIAAHEIPASPGGIVAPIGPPVTSAVIGGTAGADSLAGGGGPDALNGLGGRDILHGGPGADYLDGGDGSDVAVYDGARSDYAITVQPGEGVIVADQRLLGSDSTDTVKNVEQYQFADGLYSFNFSAATTVLADLGPALGWNSQAHFPRLVADINGDGKQDIVGFGGGAVFSALGNGDGTFQNSHIAIADFSVVLGWTDQEHFKRVLADVNGDGRADIVAFGGGAVFTSLANADGTFQASHIAIADFSVALGWMDQTEFPRVVADVNGDGKADIVAFGGGAVFTALGNGDGTFQNSKIAIADFSVALGWTDNTQFVRQLADVNGDGKLDIVGFGGGAVFTAQGNGDGTFQASKIAIADFSVALGWTDNTQFVRQLADVNNDGRADIVGFGGGAVFTALANADGTFQVSTLALADFGQAQGWASQDTTPRQLVDLNHDGKLDILGFGPNGTLIAYGNGDGSFSAVSKEAIADFSVPLGWTDASQFPRMLTDVNSDGLPDILGFGYGGVLVGLNQADYLL